MAYSQEYQPEQNAGLGLIYRLNALWEKSDRKALTGDFDGWIKLTPYWSKLIPDYGG